MTICAVALDHGAGRRVPAQAHHTGAELCLNRLQDVFVDELDRSTRGTL